MESLKSILSRRELSLEDSEIVFEDDGLPKSIQIGIRKIASNNIISNIFINRYNPEINN